MNPSPYNHGGNGHGPNGHGRALAPAHGSVRETTTEGDGSALLPAATPGDGDGGSPSRRADGQRTDEQLLADYRAGDKASFSELVSRYQRELFHFLVRFLGDRAAAEDVFQETFLQVHQSAEQFDPQRRFRPWLFTIAANKARDLIRSQARRPTNPLQATISPGDDESGEFIDLMQSASASPQRADAAGRASAAGPDDRDGDARAPARDSAVFLFSPVPVQADQRHPRYSAGNGEIEAPRRRRPFCGSLALIEPDVLLGRSELMSGMFHGPRSGHHVKPLISRASGPWPDRRV